MFINLHNAKNDKKNKFITFLLYYFHYTIFKSQSYNVNKVTKLKHNRSFPKQSILIMSLLSSQKLKSKL